MNTVVPKYLFGNKGHTYDNISKRVKSASRIILFLDYDGTLVPIKENPSSAIMTNQMEELLNDLTRANNISVFIVTGRAYTDIKKLVRIKDITIVSNHGFQITRINKNWFHPAIKQFIPSLKKVKKLLIKELNSFPSIFIEDKRITITVHYRTVEKDLIPFVKKTVSKVVSNYMTELHTTLGKMVIEVRPNIKWNKGEAVLKILKSLRIKNDTTRVLYIGDDKTDEDAFKALQQKAITIVVGRKRNSHANYYVRNTNGIHKLLESIRSLT